MSSSYPEDPVGLETSVIMGIFEKKGPLFLPCKAATFFIRICVLVCHSVVLAFASKLFTNTAMDGKHVIEGAGYKCGQGCDVSLRTKRTMPFCIFIWFGDTLGICFVSDTIQYQGGPAGFSL